MKHIFFVHDNQDGPIERRNALEMTGFKVTAIKSGEICISHLKKQKPDIVLMDILLEGENGFEICRMIRKKFGSRELPIVLASQIYRARVFREEAVKVGAQRYVLRPIKLEQLVKAIHEVIEEVAVRPQRKSA